MFGVIQWRDTGSLGRTGRQDEKMRVDLSVEEQLECTELCLGMDDEPAGSLQLRTEVWVTLQGVSAASCQTRQNKWTRASTDSWKQSVDTVCCTDDNSPIKAAEETRRGALLELNHNQGMWM